MGVQSKTRTKATVSMVIRRADGRVEKIGVVAGGSWWQRLVSWARLQVANARVARERNTGR